MEDWGSERVWVREGELASLLCWSRRPLIDFSRGRPHPARLPNITCLLSLSLFIYHKWKRLISSHGRGAKQEETMRARVRGPSRTIDDSSKAGLLPLHRKKHLCVKIWKFLEAFNTYKFFDGNHKNLVESSKEFSKVFLSCVSFKKQISRYFIRLVKIEDD